jgi:Asp/Glu/hydantoin racemase
MIVDDVELAAAAPGVVAMGIRPAADLAGIVVSAFGDPGLDALRAAVSVPVAGIFEASVLEAAAGGRRFGIATVTPGLVPTLARKAEALGLGRLFTGTRLTPGSPLEIASDPAVLERELARAVERCLDDGAEAVVIGGGPLGQAAENLARRYATPIVAPIPAAMRALLRVRLETHG